MSAILSRPLGLTSLPRPSPGLATAAAALLGLAALAGTNAVLNNYAFGNPLLGGANPRHWSPSLPPPAAGELVVVTGGSGGIGWALVTAFAGLGEGVRVVVLDRVAPPAAAQGALGGKKNNIFFYEVDLTDAAAISAVAAAVQADLGHPTVVVNNAGVARGLTLLQSTPAQIQEVFAVNAVAPLLVTRAFLPAMIAADRGHIVTVASVASFLTVASNVDYSCTKAGLMAFDEGLRQELRHRYGSKTSSSSTGGVRTTLVHPFWTATGMLAGMTEGRRFAEPVLTVDAVAAAVVGQVVAGRSGTLVVPRSLGWVAWVRALPWWLQEAMRSSKADALAVVGDT